MSISLYIHFPFCKYFCDYCDFYKERLNRVDESRFFEALISELNLAKKEIEPEQRVIETIYIGGGTPSLMMLDHLDSFIKGLRRSFHIRRNAEFSFEINPESINREKLEKLAGIGVNRPVFGIQSFNIRLLKPLKRKHKPVDSYKALYLARALGFDNFGIDMIFGLPRQTGRMLSNELNLLMELEPPHISYYQLTVEPGTPLHHKVERGKIVVPDDELSAAMYSAIYEELKSRNYFRYEVSSFAKTGYECRHNSRYWAGADYLGLGPAAHSFIGNRRFANHSNLDKYLIMLSSGKRPVVYDSDLIDDRIIETIMLSFRTSSGLNKSSFKKRFTRSVKDCLRVNYLDMVKKAELVSESNTSIKLTDRGFLVADEIIKNIIK